MFVVVAIFALCILIFVHELGHFLLAKWNGVGVLAFSIGFGPVLWKKTVGETTYSIRALPLGGYVRMVGDDPRWLENAPEDKKVDLSKDSFLEDAGLEDLTVEQQAIVEDEGRWLLNKGYWSKFSVVLAGPAFNFVFAVLLAIGSVMAFGAAEPVNKPVIGDVIPGQPAEDAGLKAKDYVQSINGRELKTWDDLSETVRGSKGSEMVFSVLRTVSRTQPDGSVKNSQITLEIKVSAVPDTSPLVSKEDKEKGDIYRIGIMADSIRKKVGVFEAVAAGCGYVWWVTSQTVLGLEGLITRNISADNIAGPIRIIGEAGKSARKGIDSLFGFMVFLSVTLAVLNLLPIPVLDGGHLMFFTIEAIKGGPISLRVKEISNQVGLAVLLLLMIFAFSNDIGHYFFHN